MSEKYHVTIFLLIFLITSPCYSVTANNYKYRKVASSNLLTHPSVQCMVQDSAGFIWIGTKDGLNRFDGYQYLTYKYDPTNNNSISNNEVSCLEVQGDENLWIGTRGGGVNHLNLKTGKITRYSYRTFDGLVNDICVGSMGEIWIATSSGLMKYIENADTHEGYFKNLSKKAVFRKETNESYIPDPTHISIRVICPLSSGKILIGADTGLFEYDQENNVFKLLAKNLRGISVTTNIIEGRYGNIWISNYKGLLKLEPQKNGGEYTQTWYNSKAEKPYRLKMEWINDIVQDCDGNIWMATNGEGVVLLKGQELIYFNKEEVKLSLGVSANVINKLFIDRDGLLWVGSESSSLLNINLIKSGFHTLLPMGKKGGGIHDFQVKAIAGQEKKLWIGTLASGIHVFDLNGIQLKYFDNIPFMNSNEQEWNDEIKALLADQEGNLWIGSSTNKLIKYDVKKGFKDYNTKGFIFSLMEDQFNNIWFGTWSDGIGYVNRTTGKMDRYRGSVQEMMGLSSNKVLSIKQSANGFLLVGTKGGGLNIAPIKDVIDRRGRFSVYTHEENRKNTISHNDIYNIFESKSGDIWLGTGRGFNRIEAAPGETLTESMTNGHLQFHEITEKEGLPGGVVYSICEDLKGYIWLGTNMGLCRYSPNEKVITVFNVNDDICLNSFENNAVYSDVNTGYLFFGGLNGLTYFNPDSLIQKGNKYVAHFTSFRILNERIEPGQSFNGRVILNEDISYTDKIELKHKENVISFEFSALQFSALNKVRYAYRLLGFNNEWLETDNENRRITYTNLKYGEYTLQVKVSKSDGTWPSEVAELHVNILPPLWLTPWAYLLYLLVIIFLLLVFRRYSIIGIKEKNELLIKEIEHRKEVEMSEAKVRFFTNVSHEIRTPLTLIYEPLQLLFKREDLPESAKDMTKMIMRNMKRLLNQVNQLLDLRKMDGKKYTLIYSKFSVEELFLNIMAEFEMAVKTKKINVKFLFPNDLFISADRQLLDTIIYNLVSNALKFIPKEGELRLEAVEGNEVSYRKNRFVQIRVCDNGPGIPENELKYVFDRFFQTQEGGSLNVGGTGIGLSIVKEYAEQHGGTVAAYNLKEGGCCFEVILPLNNTEKQSNIVVPVIRLNEEVEEIEKSAYLVGEALKKRNLTLVIIEDDIDLALYLQNIFNQHFKVVHYADGSKAYKSIGKILPDIIICDLMLPDMNGLDLTVKLKENNETSHIPVIMLTAMAEEESMIKGLDVGADSYITKPFSTNVLLAQVGSLIKSRDAFREKFSKHMVLEPTYEHAVPVEEKFIKKIMEITEKRLSDSFFEVPDIVKEMGMSHSLLLKKFKALTGLSLVEFIRSMRIKRAVQLFKQDNFLVADVAYMVGFSDPKYFSKCFTKEIGVRPSEFVKKHHP